MWYDFPNRREEEPALWSVWRQGRNCRIGATEKKEKTSSSSDSAIESSSYSNTSPPLLSYSEFFISKYIFLGQPKLTNIFEENKSM